MSSDIGAELGRIDKNYADANQKYASVIEPLSMAGKYIKNFDLDSDRAASQLGQIARRVGSNAVSRDEIIDMINKADESLVANKGKSFQDDPIALIAALDDLDKAFRTSDAGVPFGFQSQISRATSPTDILRAGAGDTSVIYEKTIGAILDKMQKDPDFDEKMRVMRTISKPKEARN